MHPHATKASLSSSTNEADEQPGAGVISPPQGGSGDGATVPPTAGESAAEKHRALWLSLGLIAFGVINVVWHLKTPGEWWFEDDPALYARVGQVEKLWHIFFVEEVNRRTSMLDHRIPARGVNELAPVLYSSMWLDLWVAPRSPAWAYAHNAVFYLATSVAFFLAMRRLVRDRWMAFWAALIWMLLPSTTTLVEFLSTRHYMIGMFFALLTILAFDDGLAATGRARRWALARVLVFGWLSILSKEFFPTALLTLTFLWGVRRRDWALVACPVALGVAYAAYRFAMIEPTIAYHSIPLMSVRQYAGMLARLPYMTLAGYAGYAMLLATAVVLARGARASQEVRTVVMVGGVTLAVSLATIYPVAYALRISWRSHGLWYRTPCVINTLLLVGFVYAVAQMERRRVRIGILAALTFVAWEGTHRTVQVLDGMKSLQKAEAEFMLANPDKILLSQVQAVWFLPGVRALYPELATGTVIYRWDQTDSDRYDRLLRSDEPIWAFEDGRVRPMSPQARNRLLAE